MKKIGFFILSLALIPSILFPCKSMSNDYNNYLYDGKNIQVNNCRELENQMDEILKQEGFKNYEIFDSSELNLDMLENRDKSKVFVERCIGIVIGKNDVAGGFNGKLLNAANKNYDYIGYDDNSNLNLSKGTIVLTYLFYNPDSNWVDDIYQRYDFVLDRSFEGKY